MKVIDHIKKAEADNRTAFSYEILPPLRGKNIDRLFKNIDALQEYNPIYINITTHRSETVFKETSEGLFKKVTVRSRPGTIAIAAAIKSRYNVNVVPHILCSGFTKEETEYALIDLQYLGIFDLLVLRGDKARHEKQFTPSTGGHSHAFELQQQISDFNNGIMCDGSKIEPYEHKFSYGVAGYPEKHEEAPNMDSDLRFLKEKVDNGAEYIVTQMFFDNAKYFAFVDMCKKAGINVPIIPGLKPITFKSQVTVLPKIFKSDIPQELSNELMKCKTDKDAALVGTEWTIKQSKELIKAGVPNIHYYTLMATQSIKQIATELF
jgi:methylenetetrahydrofolate reductase (NADPH)